MILPVLAPVLATLAANGLGLLADAVTKKGQQVVEETLGIDLTQDPSPEVLAQWKDATRQHEKELLQMVYADKNSARQMQTVALQQDDLFSKRFVYYFAWFWSVAAAVYVGFITFGRIPESNVRFADTILGFILGTVVATIVQFFFGSSFGSKEKDSFIERRLDKSGME
jgi:lipopolysaccharide export LptBFGC system permease protein LptF